VKNLSLFLLISLLICILPSCDKKNIFSKKSEGVIIYDVTFPLEQNTLMLELYPKEMTAEFKDDCLHTSVKSSYGVISTEFIVNNKEKTITQMLKSFSDKYFLNVKENELDTWRTQFPKFTFIPTDETDSIAGYLCHKTIARFADRDSTPDIELYHTSDLELDPSNWWNQFNGIDGFLLGYEIEQYGKRMKLRAKEIRFQAIPGEHFNVPQEYKQLDQQGMQDQMMQLVKEFMQ
jgi:hypothetical protein